MACRRRTACGVFCVVSRSEGRGLGSRSRFFQTAAAGGVLTREEEGGVSLNSLSSLSHFAPLSSRIGSACRSSVLSCPIHQLWEQCRSVKEQRRYSSSSREEKGAEKKRESGVDGGEPSRRNSPSAARRQKALRLLRPLSLFRRPHENKRTVLTHTLIACLRPKCSSPDRKEKANSSSSFFEKENSIAVSSERKRMGGGRDRERASVPCVLFGGGAL